MDKGRKPSEGRDQDTKRGPLGHEEVPAPPQKNPGFVPAEEPSHLPAEKAPPGRPDAPPTVPPPPFNSGVPEPGIS
jgi:hypothetical protein